MRSFVTLLFHHITPMKKIPEASLILDANNRIVGISPAGEKLLGIQQAEAMGKLVNEILPNPIFKEDSSFRIAGESLYAELRVSSINDFDDNNPGRILIVRELTQLDRESGLRNQNAILTALHETTIDLHSSLELDVVLRNIVERACGLLGTTHGFLDLLRETGELEPVVGIGALKESLKHKVVKGEGVAGIVWKTEKHLVVDDYDKWRNRVGTFRQGAIRAVVGMPLILKGRVVGVIGVARGADSDSKISENDVSVLIRFADLAVVALQNARLFERAQNELEFRRRTEMELRDANQILQFQIERVELLQGQLKELAIRDSLTELFNRRYLQEMLTVEFARSQRSGTSLAILMIDSDQLKEINDSYGHKAGDEFLIYIANVIRESIRAGDIACRYGGDEFVVVMGNVIEAVAFERAEKLRKSIASHQMAYKDEKVSISVSIGIAMYPAHGDSGEVLLQKADQALYEAKRMGKNRVFVYKEKTEIDS